MLSLNIRANDTSTIWFGTPTWFEADGPKLTEEQVAERLNGQRMLILAHGYNTGDPLDFYSRINLHIGNKYDVVAGLSWPGSHLGFAFWLAVIRAAKAGRLLTEALGSFTPASIDIEGHSLGCAVTMEALDHGLKVRNCILTAAAIDNESIQRDKKYALAVKRAETLLVAYSRHDKVLSRAYRLGMLDKALGYNGPQDPAECDKRVKLLDCSKWVNEHSQYRKCEPFFDAWRSMI
jgi:pimeloyl-ACP methyl ester carboxylesterase